MTRVVFLLVALAVATGAGLHWRWRSGRARPESPARDQLDTRLLAALGVRPGEVTLVQFSTAFCQPCRGTRRILGDVAAATPGVRHLDVDAESHLGAVRELHIFSTPTTLLVDSAGRIRNRVVGMPRKPDVLAAVGPLVGTPLPQSETTRPRD